MKTRRGWGPAVIAAGLLGLAALPARAQEECAACHEDVVEGFAKTSRPLRLTGKSGPDQRHRQQRSSHLPARCDAPASPARSSRSWSHVLRTITRSRSRARTALARGRLASHEHDD
jgi:hypothetical protein